MRLTKEGQAASAALWDKYAAEQTDGEAVKLASEGAEGDRARRCRSRVPLPPLW